MKGKHYIFGFIGLLISNLIALSSPALAETKSLSFTLSTQDNQTYKSLLEQAESLASQSIAQGFTASPSITEIVVTIIGERNGQEVPLLFTKVSRSQWQQQPQIKTWSQYFSNSAVLLGFWRTSGSQVASSNSGSNYIAKPSSIEDDPGFRDD
jgi:hypothetical protein